MVDIESDRFKIFLLISGGIGITPMQVRAPHTIVRFGPVRVFLETIFSLCVRYYDVGFWSVELT